MASKYLEKNVYQAALKRIEYTFNVFDNVLVAFSGGKDSTVCLEMCYDYAKEHNLLNKLAMYHLDYEAQYQMTTNFVTETFKRFDGIKKYWLCLPIKAQCACSAKAKGHWIPWEESKKDLWVRNMPDSPYLVTNKDLQFEFKDGWTDYDLQTKFCKWYGKTYGKTGCIIGIRADESLNRWRAVAKDDKKTAYNNLNWMTIMNKDAINVYPIYDWKVEDIWTYLGKFNKPYNELYNLYYKAGLKLNQMRVASPFNDCAMESLKLYKVIDPNNWGKMIGRVDGVNFAGLYGGTTAMGWKSITLPKGHTWKSYLEFLMNTLDEDIRNHYQRIFDVSKEYWLEKGGNVSERTVSELDKLGVKIKKNGKSVRYPQLENVVFSDYPDDIDVTEFSSVPSYKRMCICILKNDYYCQYMGFGKTKEAMEKRKRVLEKYRNLR